jgi:hypothetical protein
MKNISFPIWSLLIAMLPIATVLCPLCEAQAQSLLPVKDYSVGSQYVYQDRGQIMEEVVLRDTMILGERYGVVQSFGAIRFMRSTDTDIYEYIPIRKRDTVLYHYGQSCASPANMYWLYIPDFCSLSGTSPNSIQYAKYQFRFYAQGIDTYNGEFIEYEKPFGLVSYSAKECHPVYSPGHTTRPPQYAGGGWYQSCSGNEKIKLLSATLKGKMALAVIIDNNSAVKTVAFGKQTGFSLSLPYSQRLLSLVPEQLLLQISLDTNDIEAFEIHQSGKLSPIQRIATTGSTVTLATTLSKNLGTISFRSKSLQPREQQIAIRLLSTAANLIFPEATCLIRHQGLSVYNLSQDAQSKVAEGQNIIQHIAPNPSSNNVSVRYAMGASAEIIAFEIVNALGISVKSLSLPNYKYGVHDISIDISDLTQGIYFLKVQSNNNVEMRKIIVGR